MSVHTRYPRQPPTRQDAFQLHIAGRAKGFHDLPPAQLVASVKSHLGGDAILELIGAGEFVVDHDHISFCLDRPNPRGVHTVTLTLEPRGWFDMHCYGPVCACGASAPLTACAHQIVPENLATVLGQLTGLEFLHHRHY